MPYESGRDDDGSQVDGLSGYFSCFHLYSRKGGSIAFRGFHGVNERMREPIKLAEGRLSRVVGKDLFDGQEVRARGFLCCHDGKGTGGAANGASRAKYGPMF